MQSGVAKRRLTASTLLQVLCLLLLAGCNLDFAPDDPSPSFDGPPEIHIAAPLPNQKFQSGATVIVQARVENAGPDISRIAVLLNEELMGEQLNPNETDAEVLPLTIDWPTSNEGEYVIAVVAERGDGSSAHEDVSIMVVPRSQNQATDGASADPPRTAAEEAASTESRQKPRRQRPPAQPSALVRAKLRGIVIRPAPLRPGPGVDSGQPVGSLMVDGRRLDIAIKSPPALGTASGAARTSTPGSTPAW